MSSVNGMEIKRESTRRLLRFIAWAVLAVEVFTGWVMFANLGFWGAFSYYYRLFSHDVYLSFLMLDLWLAYLFLAIWLIQDAVKRDITNRWWWLLGFLSVGIPVLIWYLLKKSQEESGN